MSHISGGRWSKSIYAREPLRTAETRLWRGVLEQAYADAELSLEVECDDELFVDQIRARRFLRCHFRDGPKRTRLAKKKSCGSFAITPKFPSIAS